MEAENLLNIGLVLQLERCKTELMKRMIEDIIAASPEQLISFAHIWYEWKQEEA